MLFQRNRNANVQLLPSPAQQGGVGSVLHQRVLEQIGGVRSGAAAEQQSGLAELTQRGLQFSPITQRHQLDQFIRKLTAEYRADLGNFLGRHPESLQAEFPGKGAQLYAVACSGGTCDLLRNPEIAPMVAHLIEGRLMGTPYALGERRAN